MTPEERNSLIDEKASLELKIKSDSFIDPRDIRRIDEIFSLLWSNGKDDKLRLVPGKSRKSHRVTSFTRDRR